MAKKSKDSVFKITNYQPNDCVTSSSIMVEVDGIKIIFDLGLMQDSSLKFNQIYHYDMQKLKSIPFDEIDYVICQHFHRDHSGAVPILSRAETNFKGKIIATELTMALSQVIMYDSQHINETDVNKSNMKEKGKYRTYYDKDDVTNVIDMVQCYSYGDTIKLSENVTVELKPACHCSGASMSYLTYDNGKIKERLLYTSDITYGNKVDRPFTKQIENKCLKVNTLIMESTYGLRDRVTKSSENPIDFIERIIMEEVVNKNQTLWIPSFAVHRATAIYLYLYEIFQRNEAIRSANIPVFFCGKMMHEAHEIIGKDIYNEYYDEQWWDKKEMFIKQPFNFLTQKKDVERFCLNNTRKIVVSSNGMYDKGYSSLLSESYIANKKVSTINCGYQGEGTLGHSVIHGEERANVNGISKKVRLKYCGQINELSGHADHNGLISFVKSLNQNVLKNIILVHGDDVAKQELKEDLEKELSSNKNIHIIKQFETINT